MSISNRIKVKKDIYLWAIKESQIELEEIMLKFNKIVDWIEQNDSPTFRQLENLANFLKVPLGYMFLDTPPKTNIIESEFRTIGNKLPHISKNLQDTLYNMGRKQDWIVEYRKEKGWDKLIPDNYNNLNEKEIDIISQIAKTYLGISEYWYKKIYDTRLAFNYLREILESKGIIVMQNGTVGNNTHRNLDIKEFRGFLLNDDIAPLIFINSKDSINGKIFTLIHEFIHYLLQEDDIFIDELLEETIDEKRINKITAEFLIPESHVNELWNSSKDDIEQIEEFSKMFHVSKAVVAIKLYEMNKVDQSAVNRIKEIMYKELQDKTVTSGGSFYNNSRSRYSDSFAKSVVQGAEAGDISYTFAFDLFDGSAKTYDFFKEEIINYGR